MVTTSFDIPGYPPVADGFAHAASAPAGRLLLLSGQVGGDAAGNVADGLAAQVEQALVNVSLALEAAGATPADVLRLRFYVVDWSPAEIEEFMVGGGRGLAALPGIGRPAVTVAGVAALFTPDLLVEVEAEAVVEAAQAEPVGG